MASTVFGLLCLAPLLVLAQACNPTRSKPGACQPNLAWPYSTYTVDFTRQTAVPANWTVANFETVTYGPLGAEFTLNKKGDAPQIWSDFYMLGCRYEVTMQVAPGTGIVSSSVLMSDDDDEIDLEFSGNNFGASGSQGAGQNNYFGKGVTGSYDRSQTFAVASPQSQFHTYFVDWTQQSLTWGVDGQALRTLKRSDCDTGSHQYPQSPSKLQLGLWDGGDPGNNPGVVQWAGGYANLNGGPYTFYVKSISITNYNPAFAYNYSDASGSWESIQLIRDPVVYSSVFGLSATKTSVPAISPLRATSPKSGSASTAAKIQALPTAGGPTSSDKISFSIMTHLTLTVESGASSPLTTSGQRSASSQMASGPTFQGQTGPLLTRMRPSATTSREAKFPLTSWRCGRSAALEGFESR